MILNFNFFRRSSAFFSQQKELIFLIWICIYSVNYLADSFGQLAIFCVIYLSDFKIVFGRQLDQIITVISGLPSVSRQYSRNSADLHVMKLATNIHYKYILLPHLTYLSVETAQIYNTENNTNCTSPHQQKTSYLQFKVSQTKLSSSCTLINENFKL